MDDNNKSVNDLTFPTAVEPVKDILDTSRLSHMTLPTAGALGREQGTTLKTPSGTPASLAIYRAKVNN